MEKLKRINAFKQGGAWLAAHLFCSRTSPLSGTTSLLRSFKTCERVVPRRTDGCFEGNTKHWLDSDFSVHSFCILLLTLLFWKHSNFTAPPPNCCTLMYSLGFYYILKLTLEDAAWSKVGNSASVARRSNWAEVNIWPHRRQWRHFLFVRH